MVDKVKTEADKQFRERFTTKAEEVKVVKRGNGPSYTEVTNGGNKKILPE